MTPTHARLSLLVAACTAGFLHAAPLAGAQGGCEPSWVHTFGGLPGVIGGFPAVLAQAVFDDGSGFGPALYAGGQFTTAGGEPANGIAKWDGASWTAVGSGVGNGVVALAVFDDGSGSGPALYVGGWFLEAGGQQASRIAKWDGRSWSAVGADRIEVLLTAETKNHLEYLVFEDLKPAGFEAVQVQSGAYMVARELKASEVERRFVEGGRREEVLIPGSGAAPWSWRHEEGYTGRTQSLHQELRDRHVAFFADRLPQGVWEMRYELRAETPGKFHALPTMAHAMYVPEIRGNSDELRVEVVDEGVL